MQNGNFLIKNFDPIEIEKYCPGVNGTLLNLLIDWINNGMEDRKGEWFIFLNPTLDDFARHNKISFKEAYSTFLSLNKLRPERISQKAVFENSELHYVLNEYDIEDVNSKNMLHNPDNPDIVYDNARDSIRNAFVIKSKVEYERA